MNITKKDINKSINDNGWDFFNSILYQLCSRHFEHKSIDVVMAKICIIGRTYSASIERRKTKDETGSDDFYSKKVAPAIINSDIDKCLRSLKKYKRITDENISGILETHFKVMKLFNKISGLNKRSLASKYLHFHLPNLFYIYDSRAVQGLRNILPGFRVKEMPKKYDNEYSKLVFKVFHLQKEIEKKYNRRLSTRQLDKLLLLKS